MRHTTAHQHPHPMDTAQSVGSWALPQAQASPTAAAKRPLWAVDGSVSDDDDQDDSSRDLCEMSAVTSHDYPSPSDDYPSPAFIRNFRQFKARRF